MDSLALNVGVGPSVTIGDYDVTRTQTVNFTDPGKTLAYAPVTESDDGTDILFGGFASLGLKWMLSEELSVQADVKYEYIASEVETDFADFGISGLGGDLKLVFRF